MLFYIFGKLGKHRETVTFQIPGSLQQHPHMESHLGDSLSASCLVQHVTSASAKDVDLNSCVE